MEEAAVCRQDPLRDWLAVEGDLDVFLFYGSDRTESEK